jgi:recombination protein RecA
MTKKAALRDTLSDIEALYGPGTIVMGSDPTLRVVRRETGVLPLDVQLDGGLPRGRFIEVYGPYSTLKTYWAYKALGAAQARGETTGLLDYEHSFEPDWATACGVDVDSLAVSRPETAEQGMGILNAHLAAQTDVLVWDSIAAAQPRQYREAAPGDDEAPAALARVMSRGLARTNTTNQHSTVIFINQTRHTIGQVFGAKQTTSGGRAMGFYAAMRLSFTRTGKITEKVERWDGEKMVVVHRVIGHKIQSVLEKSKVSAPYTESHFVFDLRTGAVDDVGYLIGVGLEHGLITRGRTGHYAVPGVLDHTIHGADRFREWIEENPEVQEWLLEAVLPKNG